MGAAPGPCPAWRPKAPGLAALTPWPPPAGKRGRRGEVAGRGRGRPGQSAEPDQGAAVEPHQGRGLGPHPRPRTAPRGRTGERARGTGRAPVGGIQRWAWDGCSGDADDGSPAPVRESPGTLRSTSGVTGHSLRDPHSPRSCRRRPKGEAGRRCREPPACSGACARQAQLGPGKGKPDGMNAQAREGVGALRSREPFGRAQSPSLREENPKGRSPCAHAHT